MKKFFAAAVALMMLFALCVPAFAGTAIDALTDANAKEIATAVAQQLDQNTTANFSQQNYRDQFVDAAAAAITAGAVALMLEWLLFTEKVPGIDSFQIRSLLILGAVRPGTMDYPNREWGYGQLNLYNTFETMRRL